MHVYMDQAGNPSPRDPSPYSVLLCICVEHEKSREVARRLHRIKQDYLTLPIVKKVYGLMHELGLESPSNLRPLQKVIKAGDPTSLELKGIYFARKEAFRDIANSAEIVNSVFGLLDAISAVFAIVMPRPSSKPYTPPGQLTRWHYFMLQRIHSHMKALQHSRIATIVSDEYGREQDAELAAGISNFLFRSSEGQQYDSILETPLFVDSGLCPGIQIADVFAYVGRQYYCHGLESKKTKDPYELWIKRLWEQEIKPKSPDYPNPLDPSKTNYGIYKMPAEAYEKAP